MYPLIPCGNCGGGIQFFPQFAGCGVICPYCGVTVQMPGGEAPSAVTESPEITEDIRPQPVFYRPRKARKSAPIWPSVILGAGLSIITYTLFIRDSSWMVVQLNSPTDTIPAALLRRFSAGLDTPGSSGLILGVCMTLFGLACFALGRKTK